MMNVSRRSQQILGVVSLTLEYSPGVASLRPAIVVANKTVDGVDVIDAKVGRPANLINIIRLGRSRLRHEQDKRETNEYTCFRLHHSQTVSQSVRPMAQCLAPVLSASSG